jgi:hypothetical protein
MAQTPSNAPKARPEGILIGVFGLVLGYTIQHLGKLLPANLECLMAFGTLFGLILMVVYAKRLTARSHVLAVILWAILGVALGISFAM